jgi:spore maturation protein CgeB
LFNFNKMCILALRPDGLVIPYIHASMTRAFGNLGVEVLELPFPIHEENLQTLKSFTSPGPAAVFTLDLPLHSDVKRILKSIQKTLQIPWMIWFLDDPEGYGFPDCCDPAWTMILCWDREITNQISRQDSWKGIPPVHLPLATDPEMFYPQSGFPLLFPEGVFVGSTAHPNPMLDEAIQNAQGFLNDVSNLWEIWKRDLSRFPHRLAWEYLEKRTGKGMEILGHDPLARLWLQAAVYALGIRKRTELVSRIMGEGGAVFGDRGWHEISGDLYRGKVAYGDDLRRVYNGAGFILDVRQPQARTGLTQRMFDASACGRPVLTEFSPEIESLFDPEKEVLVFHDIEEAQEMKKWIFTHPQTATERGDRARTHVLALHTYRHRAVQILKTLQRFFPGPCA